MHCSHTSALMHTPPEELSRRMDLMIKAEFSQQFDLHSSLIKVQVEVTSGQRKAEGA